MKKTIAVLAAAAIFLSGFFAIPVQAAQFDINFATESKSVYLENLDTGIVVYAKEPDARRYY